MLLYVVKRALFVRSRPVMVQLEWNGLLVRAMSGRLGETHAKTAAMAMAMTVVLMLVVASAAWRSSTRQSKVSHRDSSCSRVEINITAPVLPREINTMKVFIAPLHWHWLCTRLSSKTGLCLFLL